MKSSSIVFAGALLASLLGSARADGAPRWYEVSEGGWRVPAGLIPEMRSKIQEAANAAVASSVTKERRSISNDTFQYQGIFVGKAKTRAVQVWGMCKTDWSPAKLRSHWATVVDGGNCYYTATYDPIKKKFLSFMFNGAA